MKLQEFCEGAAFSRKTQERPQTIHKRKLFGEFQLYALWILLYK